MGVHADAEPSDTIGTSDTHDSPTQDEGHSAPTHVGEKSEIKCDGGTDENKEADKEFALLFEISGAGLEDDVADFEHGFMGAEFAHIVELPNAEEESEHNN